jgi:hypothetical protein
MKKKIVASVRISKIKRIAIGAVSGEKEESWTAIIAELVDRYFLQIIQSQ